MFQENGACMHAHSCLTLCDPMNCSPPGSSLHEILQARILEWVAMPSSRGSSQPRIKPMSPASPAWQVQENGDVFCFDVSIDVSVCFVGGGWLLSFWLLSREWI